MHLRFLGFIAIMVAFISCEAPESHNQRQEQKKNVPLVNESRTPTLVVRGMYSTKGDRVLHDCSSGKRYNISEKSQLAKIDEVSSGISDDKERGKIYIEAEGFISAEQNRNTKNIDTVFVIGAISRIDLQFDCGIK